MNTATFRFRFPPVVEVALSVQFAPLSDMTAGHLGLLWSRFRDRFPICSEHPALEPLSSDFDSPTTTGPKIRFIRNPASDVRLWFVDKSRSDLVQVQRDRFARNWRKTKDGQAYPHYKHVRDSFSHDIDVFASYVREEGLPKLEPNQCEMTYVDHIEPMGVWEHHGQLDRVTTLWKKVDADVLNCHPEYAKMNCAYLLHDANGVANGRLQVSFEPAYRDSDQMPIFIMKSVLRGQPEEASVPACIDFFDQGRELIRRAFISLTTPQMQEAWEPER